MNQNDDLPHLIIGNRSDSTQSPDGDACQRTVVTPYRSSSLPSISSYSRTSTIQQQLEMQNFNPGPRIPTSIPPPSFVSSSVPPLSPLPTFFPTPPSSLSVRRSLNSGLPPIAPSSASFRSETWSDYDLPTQWSPNAVLPQVSPSSTSFQSAPFSGYEQPLLPVQRSPNSCMLPVTPSFQSTPSSGYDASMVPVGWSPNLDHTLPQRNANKRCNTDDISFGTSDSISAPSFMVGGKSQEEDHREREDQYFSEYMNEEALTSNENIGNEENNETGSTSNLGVKRRACNQMTRSVSVDSFTYGNFSTGALSPDLSSSTYSGIFTALELNKIKADKKLSEIAARSPKEAKRILANRAAAVRSKEKRAQYTSDLEAENTTLKTMNNQMQEERIAMEKELRELKIRQEETEKHAHLLQAHNGQLNAQLIELTNELNQYRREIERLTMQQSPSQNMFQELNINHLHHPQRNPDFDDQI